MTVEARTKVSIASGTARPSIERALTRTNRDRPIEPFAVLGFVRLRGVRAGSACRVGPKRRSRCAGEGARPSTDPSLVCAQGSEGSRA